ncbi:hypothetical protein DOY81_010073 [Sarcophaga bullata]|nr:hypothetical protein DOY81_010073 [Sarcophaga bullata]
MECQRHSSCKIINCYYGTWANYRPGDGKFEATDINPSHLCTHVSHSSLALHRLGVSGIAHGKIINCYYGTWANYRAGDGKFEATDINPHLCTHVSYSFFGITPAGEFQSLDTWLDNDLGFISKTIALKRINPKLKILAVVGGWNEGSTKYSNMAADAIKRQVFIQSSLKFILKHGFDGLDLDWEYPALRGGRPQDKVNFVTLLKEIREAFKPHNLELGIAVSASAETARISYDIPNIAKQVDFINVMTYDFATSWDGKLGFNAPLMGQGENNVKSAINYWLQQGAPAKKLILGLAFYGRTFALSNLQQITVGAPSTGPGIPGPYTREGGFMGYNEICSLEKSWNYKYSTEHEVPIIYNSNQWIGYDNVQSLVKKVDYANAKNLGGVMIWSIETDDFRGRCGSKYPLLNAVNNQLGNTQGGNDVEVEVPQEPSEPSSPPTKPEPKPEQPTASDCSVDGFIVDANDCSVYYQCAGGVPYKFACSPGLYFDQTVSACNWAKSVQCNN